MAKQSDVANVLRVETILAQKFCYGDTDALIHEESSSFSVVRPKLT